MNFISKLIHKTGKITRKSDLTSLSTAAQAEYIIKKGKFIEKRTSGNQTLELYLFDQAYFELLSSGGDKVISKVMEITDANMERFYGRSIEGRIQKGNQR